MSRSDRPDPQEHDHAYLWLDDNDDAVYRHHEARFWRGVTAFCALFAVWMVAGIALAWYRGRLG